MTVLMRNVTSYAQLQAVLAQPDQMQEIELLDVIPGKVTRCLRKICSCFCLTGHAKYQTEYPNWYSFLSQYVQWKYALDRQDYRIIKIVRRAMYHNSDLLSMGKHRVGDLTMLCNFIDNSMVSQGQVSLPPLFPANLQIDDCDLKNFIEYVFTEVPLEQEWTKFRMVMKDFITKDPTYFSQVCKIVQSCLDHRYKQLTDGRISTPIEEKLAKISIRNLVSVLAFLNIKDTDRIRIPQRINRVWKQVTYQPKPIRLSYWWLGDPVNAYAFSPVDLADNASPLLVFMGTTPPGFPGSLLTLWTDFVPFFYMVGEFLFRMGCKKIRNCIDDLYAANNNRPVKLMGMSLGGAIILHVLADFLVNFDKVKSYIASSPYYSSMKLRKYKNKVHAYVAANNRFPRTKIVTQDNDIVARIGKCPPTNDKTRIFHLMPKPTPDNRHPFTTPDSHLKSFINCKDVIVLESSSAYENAARARTIVSIGYRIIAPIFFVGYTMSLAFQASCYVLNRVFTALFYRPICQKIFLCFRRCLPQQ